MIGVENRSTVTEMENPPARLQRYIVQFKMIRLFRLLRWCHRMVIIRHLVETYELHIVLPSR
ncbi:hypothetical protein WT27_25915 [Burkholderia territorii]|uniref:Uncharacterized protein n=1 Tax=Burkholderia territorii TaxID=1503055 RepID=A0A119DLW9_9BURK|nr:hypothetical protein WT27_25915 [Burkholderia territorii]KVX36590.1 hypothetical protein WT31_00305 [Burkholderia territorii]